MIIVRVLPVLFLMATVSLVFPRAAEGEPRGGGPQKLTAPTYTSVQSEHGKELFERSCAGCHSLDSGKAAPVGLGSPSFRSRWNTGLDLFGKSSLTMPANKIQSLRAEDYVDLVAFLLD